MKLKALTSAIILAAFPAAGAFAAALDRSGQSISNFLQPGNYFEAGISILDPDVSGQEAGLSTTRRNIEDMAGDYYFPHAALKLQVNDQFSFGLIYDQPFGADAEYTGNNVFVSDDTNTILGATQLSAIRTQTITSNINQQVTLQAQSLLNNNQLPDGTSLAQAELFIRNNNTVMEQITSGVTQAVDIKLNDINDLLGTGGTKVEVDTQNLAMIFGFQPTENWNVYAGPVWQTVRGKVSLRGQAYSIYNGYDANIKETEGYGWLAGVAYQLPEIALKASLTYRSEIDHDINIRENIPTLPALALIGEEDAATAITNSSSETKITTPQSVNFDFQTGIMANTVGFANIRWVNWKDFAIQPYKFGQLSKVVGPLVSRPDGFNLVEYSDDQWSVTTGVGRKFNDKWAGNVSVGWDSGAGDPITTLGPTKGYWNVGLGAQYSPTPQTFIGGGIKYFWLGDAKAQTGAQAGTENYVAEFKNNNAIAYGLKIGYKF